MTVEHDKIGIPGNESHLDSVRVDQNPNEKLHREVVVQGDPEDFEALAKVDLVPKASRVILYNNLGSPIGSTIDNGGIVALNVHSADVHSRVVNTPLHSSLGTSTVLNGSVLAGVTQIEVENATDFSVGRHLLLFEGNNLQQNDPLILNVAGTTITFDTPLDFDMTPAGTVRVVDMNMAVAVGSLASPVIFEEGPHGDETWHIERINFSITHKTAASDVKFGGLAALTNGVVLRGIQKGVIRTLANWKSNSDMIADMFDVEYTDRAGPTAFGTRGRWSVRARAGAVIRLSAADGDLIQLLIQDDMTASTGELEKFTIKFQGHVVGP